MPQKTSKIFKNDSALNPFDVIMHGMKELSLLREQISKYTLNTRLPTSTFHGLSKTADLLDEFIQQSFVRSHANLTNEERFSIKQSAIKQGHGNIQRRISTIAKNRRLLASNKFINERTSTEH